MFDNKQNKNHNWEQLLPRLKITTPILSLYDLWFLPTHNNLALSEKNTFAGP